MMGDDAYLRLGQVLGLSEEDWAASSDYTALAALSEYLPVDALELPIAVHDIRVTWAEFLLTLIDCSMSSLGTLSDDARRSEWADCEDGLLAAVALITRLVPRRLNDSEMRWYCRPLLQPMVALLDLVKKVRSSGVEFERLPGRIRVRSQREGAAMRSYVAHKVVSLISPVLRAVMECQFRR